MKEHSLHFMFTWAAFLILFGPYRIATESCFHDDRNISAVEHSQDGDDDQRMGNITSVQHSQDRNDNDRMKMLAEEVYKPLRITTVYSINNLSDDEQNALKRVMGRAVRKITSILSVIRKDELLLLPRSACGYLHRSGINIRKCQEMKKGYKGEYCMDGFRIPSAHLEGLAVYNKTHPYPVKTYVKNGPGLRNTDFVLYVTSQMTSLCNPFKTSALAYATYCKLDNNSRPIAGQVNFCPRTVKAQKFDEGLIYK